MTNAAKEWMGLLSLAVTVAQYAPYCWSTFKGKIKPHVFSYLIWGISGAVVFVAQYGDGGGAGAWARGLSTIAAFLIAFLSMRTGVDYVTRSDWVALLGALASIPLWIVTKSPLSAVILITLVDALAYWPTFRKAYKSPYEDSPSTYMVGGVKHGFSLLALENFDMTTSMTSILIIAANVLVISLLFIRRAVVRRHEI